MASGMELNSQDLTDTLFPCGNCHSPLTYDHKGLQCETCDKWYHAPCQRVGDLQYDYLSNSSCSWHCTKCNSANYSLISNQDLSSFATNNPFSTLDSTPDGSFNQTQTSTPAKKKPLKVFRKTDSSVNIALINFQSIREKKPLFYTFIDLNKPDIIVGTETWLTAEIHDNEIFPPELGYTVYRRDRIGKRGGGVIIQVNSKFTSVLRSEFNTNCENLWVQLNLAGAKSVLIGADYKPHKADPESIASFEELKKSLTLVSQTNSAVWLLGDLNLPEIDWENLIPSPECGHPTFYRDCLEVLDDCPLEQMVTSPTRGQNILDLFLTTNPILVDSVSITPGLSDHDIVLIQVNVKPEVLKQVPRNIYLYKKADYS